MADVDMTTGNDKQIPAPLAGVMQNVVIPVDWAAVLEAKGSALANGDLIQIYVPPNGSWVMSGALHTIVPPTNATVLTLNLGLASDDNAWINQADGVTPAVETSLWVPTHFASADTVDIDVEAITGTLDDGKLVAILTVLPMYEGMLSSLK